MKRQHAGFRQPDDIARIPHLPAALAVERRAIEYQRDRLRVADFR